MTYACSDNPLHKPVHVGVAIVEIVCEIVGASSHWYDAVSVYVVPGD